MFNIKQLHYTFFTLTRHHSKIKQRLKMYVEGSANAQRASIRYQTITKQERQHKTHHQ